MVGGTGVDNNVQIGLELMKTFSIVIPSRNLHNARECYCAIRNNGEDSQVLLIWDWAGKKPGNLPDIKAAINQSDPNLIVMSGREPFIFSRNANIGAQAAGRSDVFLVNDDAVLQDGFTKSITQLSTVVYNSPQQGIVAGIVGAAVKGYPHPTNPSTSNSYNVRVFDRAVPFVAVYIRREVFDNIGWLDERYTGWAPTEPVICPHCGWRPASQIGPGGVPIGRENMTVHCPQCTNVFRVTTEEVYGGEDDDYCYRARRHGYSVGIWDGCVVDHACLPSTFRPDGRGRSIVGTRARFHQIHGYSMGEK
jgi:GT2 family glycosyltransferase